MYNQSIANNKHKKRKMLKVRITKQTKQTIAHTVARQWIESATQILSDGGKPATFTKCVNDSVWAKICTYYDSRYDVASVSDRVFKSIVAMAKVECKKQLWLKKEIKGLGL